jgi:hypothetical protein
MLVDSGAIISARALRYGKVTFEPGLLLRRGESRTLSVGVELDTNAPQGNCIGFELQGRTDVVTDRGIVSLSRRATLPEYHDISYIKDSPDGVKVDGAFADWYNTNMTTDTLSDVVNEDLDIDEYAFYADMDILAFFVMVDGHMVRGVDVPFENEMKVVDEKYVQVSHRDRDRDGIWDEVDPFPLDFDNDGLTDANDIDDDNDGAIDYPDGGQDEWLIQQQTGVRIYIGPHPSPPPATGDDVIYIFIDGDEEVMTGYPVGGIGADIVLEIKGKHGDVTKSVCLEYTGSESKPWLWDFRAEVDAEVDYSRLEVGAAPSILGIDGDFRFFVITHSWNNGSSDSTEAITGGRGTRTPENDNVILNEIYPEPAGGDVEWIEFFNPTASDIDLNNWYLDSASKFGYFQFSNSTVVGSKSYKTVDENWFGSGFLAADDSLTLYDDGTNNVDFTSWEEVDTSSESWARYYDFYTGEPVDNDSASDWYISTNPTPGAINDQCIPEFDGFMVPSIFTLSSYLAIKRKLRHKAYRN